MKDALEEIEHRNAFIKAVLKGYSAIKEFLIKEGNPNPSHKQMKKAVKSLRIFKCVCCDFCTDCKKDLTAHLKENEKHAHGQKKHRSAKKNLLDSVVNRTQNKSLKFSDLRALYDTLTPHEKSLLYKILYTELFLIKFR